MADAAFNAFDALSAPVAAAGQGGSVAVGAAPAQAVPETFNWANSGRLYRVVPGTTGVLPEDAPYFHAGQMTPWQKAGQPPPPIGGAGTAETPPNFTVPAGTSGAAPALTPPAVAIDVSGATPAAKAAPAPFNAFDAIGAPVAQSAPTAAGTLPTLPAIAPQGAEPNAITPIGGSAADVAAHAMTLGADDVMLPAIGASLNSLLRPLIPGAPQATWGEDYARLQSEQRAARHGYEAANPVTSAAAGVAGSVATPGVSSLFGVAPPGSGLIGRGINVARNIAAGAGLGGAAGFGESEGDLQARLAAAKTGAETGGVLAAAAPVIPAAVSAVRRAANALPLAEIVSRPAQEASVAANIAKASGAAPIATSPVGPLDLAQATGSPEIAAKVRYAQGTPEGAAAANAIRTQQSAAVGSQIAQVGTPATEADASADFVKALRAGRKVAGSEENRLWTVPKLADTKVSRGAVQSAVNQAVADLDPVLRDSMSPQLRALVNRVNAKGETAVRDLNGIRSDLERIARNSRDGAERSMARTLSDAFLDGLDATPEIAGAPAGVPTGGTAYARDAQGILRPVPEIGPPIAADPEIAAAYKTAREYTRRMRTLFADPEAASLLAKTEGVYRVDPSEGAKRFFNFSAGAGEGPQSIAELAAFVDTLRAQPAAGQVAQDMLGSARSYVAAALSKASRLGEGQNFNPKTMQDFLRVNMPWIRSSGLFEPAQIEAADRLLDYAGLLRRTEGLNWQSNSATISRYETGKTFIDQIMRPWIRHMAELGATIASFHAGGEVAGAITAGASAAFDASVRNAEQAMRELMASAVLDSRVAQDLQQRVTAATTKRLSPKTVALMQRIGAQVPAAGFSAPPPATAESGAQQ